MDYLQQLLDGSNFPLMSAFILGLMTAISPCPLATNITAVAYIGKNIEDRRKVFINGLLYTLGRAISYVSLGVILFLGASKFQLASIFQGNGEKILGPLLLIVGILMLDVIKIRFPGLGKLSDKFQQSEKKAGKWTALLMGLVFALAFCPYSGVLYFGMLIPMTISSASGLLLPLVFAIATGLPVVLFAYLIAFTLGGVGKWYKRLNSFERWFRRIVALLFILVGLYYILVLYIF